MKEIKRKGRFKRVVKRIVKGMLIVIRVITALTIVLSVGTYLYNRSCLEKEAKLILHDSMLK